MEHINEKQSGCAYWKYWFRRRGITFFDLLAGIINRLQDFFLQYFRRSGCRRKVPGIWLLLHFKFYKWNGLELFISKMVRLNWSILIFLSIRLILKQWIFSTYKKQLIDWWCDDQDQVLIKYLNDSS